MKSEYKLNDNEDKWHLKIESIPNILLFAMIFSFLITLELHLSDKYTFHL